MQVLYKSWKILRDFFLASQWRFAFDEKSWVHWALKIHQSHNAEIWTILPCRTSPIFILMAGQWSHQFSLSGYLAPLTRLSPLSRVTSNCYATYKVALFVLHNLLSGYQGTYFLFIEPALCSLSLREFTYFHLTRQDSNLAAGLLGQKQTCYTPLNIVCNFMW